MVVNLPKDVLAGVAAFLVPRQVCALGCLARHVDELLEGASGALATALDRGHGGLRLHPAECGRGGARRALRLLDAASRTPAPLPFRGIATDGGVDDGDMQFWCDAAFRPERWLVYSSGAVSRAVALAAAFAPDRGAAPRDEETREFVLARLREAGRFLDAPDRVGRDRVQRHFNMPWIQPSSGFLRNSRRDSRAQNMGP